jgi:hypothetical protein
LEKNWINDTSELNYQQINSSTNNRSNFFEKNSESIKLPNFQILNKTYTADKKDQICLNERIQTKNDIRNQSDNLRNKIPNYLECKNIFTKVNSLLEKKDNINKIPFILNDCKIKSKNNLKNEKDKILENLLSKALENKNIDYKDSSKEKQNFSIKEIRNNIIAKYKILEDNEGFKNNNNNNKTANTKNHINTDKSIRSSKFSIYNNIRSKSDSINNYNNMNNINSSNEKVNNIYKSQEKQKENQYVILTNEIKEPNKFIDREPINSIKEYRKNFENKDYSHDVNYEKYFSRDEKLKDFMRENNYALDLVFPQKRIHEKIQVEIKKKENLKNSIKKKNISYEDYAINKSNYSISSVTIKKKVEDFNNSSVEFSFENSKIKIRNSSSKLEEMSFSNYDIKDRYMSENPHDSEYRFIPNNKKIAFNDNKQNLEFIQMNNVSINNKKEIKRNINIYSQKSKNNSLDYYKEKNLSVNKSYKSIKSSDILNTSFLKTPIETSKNNIFGESFIDKLDKKFYTSDIIKPPKIILDLNQINISTEIDPMLIVNAEVDIKQNLLNKKRTSNIYKNINKNNNNNSNLSLNVSKNSMNDYNEVIRSREFKYEGNYINSFERKNLNSEEKIKNQDTSLKLNSSNQINTSNYKNFNWKSKIETIKENQSLSISKGSLSEKNDKTNNTNINYNNIYKNFKKKTSKNQIFFPFEIKFDTLNTNKNNSLDNTNNL